MRTTKTPPPDVEILLPLLDKRWRDGAQTFVVPANIFDPRALTIDPISPQRARLFLRRHHYSHSMPPARLTLGVFERTDLVGALAFTVPMSQAVVPKWLSVAPSAGIELGRFVLLDHIGFNAESYVIARALRILKTFDPALRGVVSFADPLERRDPRTACITKRAHYGTMYRASNAAFRGRTAARWIVLAPNGAFLSARTLSKLRNDERGRDYAERQLVSAGVPHRMPYESGATWLDRVLPTLTRAYHPGNLAFTFSL